MSFDPTSLITGISASAATVWAAWLVRAGRRSNQQQQRDDEHPGVSLTKVIDGTQAELDYSRGRVHALEAKVEQLEEELAYAHARNVELGGP